MKTATRPDHLDLLGNLLQAGLQLKFSPNSPLQVRCLLKDETLVILAQHPADVMLDSQHIFSYLEQTLLAQHQVVMQHVKMYLRIAGQKQPYASHAFTVEPTPTAIPGEEKFNISYIPNVFSPEATDNVETANQDSEEPASPHPWDEPIPGAELPADELLETEETSTSSTAKTKMTMLPLIVAGAGLSLAVFFTTLYVLTRPCVLGRQCTAIAIAEELSQESAQTLQNPESGKAVLEAQEQLDEAINLLVSIPWWSRHHSQAQTLLQSYQTQADKVDEMVTALKTAARAAYKSENPPHPASRWIEVQGLWREAIAKLEQLPTNSHLQPLAKQKIKEYKAALAQTNQRLVKEREARERLRVAKDAALIAEARQGVAQSLPHWQLVYATWQTALNRLKEIPQGTTAYEEAQNLTALYLPKMATARDRKTQEQIATNAYNQGLRLAQLAQTSQSSNQWTAALVHWRNALTYVNQVPSNTFYYTKAQSLVPPYTNALKQAQTQLQWAVKVQQARRDLNQTCYSKTQVCNYTIENNVIKVRLTPAYVEQVRQAALVAQSSRDANAQEGLVNHILTLGEALEAISDNARIRVEVYNPDGTLIETHAPG